MFSLKMRVCPTRVNMEVRVLQMESSTTTANVCPTSLPVTAMCCSTVSLITFSFFHDYGKIQLVPIVPILVLKFGEFI